MPPLLFSQGVQTVHGHSTEEYLYTLTPDLNFKGLRFRYGDHSDWDLYCSGGGAPYTIRESDDRTEFELFNNLSHRVIDRCPNFGKIDNECLRVHFPLLEIFI